MSCLDLGKDGEQHPTCLAHGLVSGLHPVAMQCSFPQLQRGLQACSGQEAGRSPGVWTEALVWRDEGERGLSSAPMAKTPKDAASGQSHGHVPAVPRRYLFWTEWGQYPRIERSRLDGTERMVLVNVSISWPNGISVDYEVQPLAGRTVLRGGLAGSMPIPRVPAAMPLGTRLSSPGPWSLPCSAGVSRVVIF